MHLGCAVFLFLSIENKYDILRAVSFNCAQEAAFITSCGERGVEKVRSLVGAVRQTWAANWSAFVISGKYNVIVSL